MSAQKRFNDLLNGAPVIMISMLVVSLGLSFTVHHVLTPIVGGKLERKES